MNTKRNIIIGAGAVLIIASIAVIAYVVHNRSNQQAVVENLRVEQAPSATPADEYGYGNGPGIDDITTDPNGIIGLPATPTSIDRLPNSSNGSNGANGTVKTPTPAASASPEEDLVPADLFDL